jgi:UDP-MurNAc hydroxylase
VGRAEALLGKQEGKRKPYLSIVPEQMRITYLGQSGLYIETRAGSILCDPWFNPCYFASWFPFPDNEALDPNSFSQPDFLFISHEHRDHLDSQFLRDHVSKETTVLLPDYPVRSLERNLRGLGFETFLYTGNAQPINLGGVRIAIMAMVTPSDGPEGDSALIVDDGVNRVFNQNDSRPTDLDLLQAFGPYDAHFVQFSGAIWYPMVYRLAADVKNALGAHKRANQQERALAFMRQIGARQVFPCGGPPCFLDDELFHLNDLKNDPSNIFCDQAAFLDFMRSRGVSNGRLIIPGSVITLDAGRCTTTHPVPAREIDAIFSGKAAYLEAYRARRKSQIEAARAALPTEHLDLLTSLQDKFEPLLALADQVCAGIGARVLLDCSGDRIAIDFISRSVYRWRGQYCRYRFWVDRLLIEACLRNEEEDWVNSLFLSLRFQAERDGPYNEYLYNFFKCLSLERLQYAEAHYAAQANRSELLEIDGHMIQRRCPHLKADLEKFGRVENGVLTCTMHGWQFDLATGQCLTSDQCSLYTRPLNEHEDVSN